MTLTCRHSQSCSRGVLWCHSTVNWLTDCRKWIFGQRSAGGGFNVSPSYPGESRFSLRHNDNNNISKEPRTTWVSSQSRLVAVSKDGARRMSVGRACTLNALSPKARPWRRGWRRGVQVEEEYCGASLWSELKANERSFSVIRNFQGSR